MSNGHQPKGGSQGTPPPGWTPNPDGSGMARPTQPASRPLMVRYVLMNEGAVDCDRTVHGRPVPRVGDEVDTGGAVYTVTVVRWNLGLSPSDPDLGGTQVVQVFATLSGTWERGNLLRNTGRCRAGEESP